MLIINLLIVFAFGALNQYIEIQQGINSINGTTLIQYVNKSSESLHIHYLQDGRFDLFICSTVPNEITQDLTLIENNNGCVYPLRTTDKNQLKISFEDYRHTFQLMYQTYSAKSDQFFIIINSQYAKQGNLTIEVHSNSDCLSSCQNSGNCIEGFCVCATGYIGSDCSVKLEQLFDYQILESGNLYYIDGDVKSQVDLYSGSKYYLDCYYSNLHFETYPEYQESYLALTTEQIKQCSFYRDENQNNLNNTKLPLYFVILKSSANTDIFNLSTLIVASVLGFFVIGFCILFCVFRRRYYRQMARIDNQQPQRQNLQKVLDCYMPIFQFKSMKREMKEFDQNSECVICLNEYQDSDKIRMTYCRHSFHDNCIYQWLQSHQTCPICRSNLDIKSLEAHHHDHSLLTHKNETHADNLLQI